MPLFLLLTLAASTVWVRSPTCHRGGVGWYLPSTDRKNRSEAAAPITCPATQVKEALTAVVFAPYPTSCIAFDSLHPTLQIHIFCSNVHG